MTTNRINPLIFSIIPTYHPDIIASMESMGKEINGNMKLYGILQGLDKKEEEIMAVIQLTPTAYRVIISRYNKILKDTLED